MTRRSGLPGLPALAISIALAAAPPASAIAGDGWLSLHGTSGLVLTPTAEVAPEATVQLGYSFLDREWVSVGRGHWDNELYYLTFGFLSRVELTVRATVLPGSRLSPYDDAPAVDRLGSARFQILRPGRFPALAIGVDDVRGTRLFHSLYGVATHGFEIERAWLDFRLTAGYGSRALEAKNHVLDGAFGGIETRVRRSASFTLEHDTEKWNAGVRLQLFRRVGLQLAWLNLETPSWGAAWTHRF